MYNPPRITLGVGDVSATYDSNHGVLCLYQQSKAVGVGVIPSKDIKKTPILEIKFGNVESIEVVERWLKKVKEKMTYGAI